MSVKPTHIGRRGSISIKLLSFYLPMIIIGLSVVFTFLEFRNYQTQMTSLRENMESFVSTQAKVLASPVWHLDTATLDILVKVMSLNQDVLKIQVLDLDGKVISETTLLADLSEHPDLYVERPLIFSSPAVTQKIGQLVIYYHTDRAWITLKQHLIVDMVVLVILCGLLILTTLIVTRKIISLPIDKLQNSIMRMKLDNIREPVEWSSKDEFGDFITVYNEMQAQQFITETRFRDFAESSSDWFWELDVYGRIIWESESADDKSGRLFAEIRGKTLPEISGDLLSDIQWRPYFLALKNHKKITDFVFSYVGHNGLIRYSEIDGKPLFDKDGVFMGYRGTASDVTERKNAEEILQLALSDAERANRAKSEFLASMSHELRTPMNAVLGFAQMLQLDPKSPLTVDQSDYVECILAGGHHLLELINEILDLAKVESDQLHLSVEDVDACAVVIDCLELTLSLGKMRNIKIIDQFSDGPSFLLRTDRLRFKQVLLNLLANAVKYNKDGGAIILDYHETDDGFLHISITDTGIGIPLGEYDNVFNMFHRLGVNPEVASEGTGIGLTVTKLLVERMAGRVGFQSEEGIGSTFWIELPLSTNLKALIWSDVLRVGIDAIDKDHQVIIRLLNKLTHRTVGQTDLSSVLLELIDYTEHHFRREEIIMKACDYPDLKDHISDHRKFIDNMNVLIEDWRMDSNQNTLHALRQFLRDWWIDHIVEVDVKIAEYTIGKELRIKDALAEI